MRRAGDAPRLRSPRPHAHHPEGSQLWYCSEHDSSLTFLHELFHAFGGLVDEGYMDDRACVSEHRRAPCTYHTWAESGAAR